MNNLNMPTSLLKDIGLELSKWIMTCAIGSIIYNAMKNKYSTLTITNTIMLMVMLMILTDGNTNYWIVTFFVMLTLYYAIFILMEKNSVIKTKTKITLSSKTKNITDSSSNHTEHASFDLDDKSDYIQYLIKKFNIPHKIAIKYINYCTNNLEKTISLISFSKETKKFYFAKSISNDLVTLVYIGGVKIKHIQQDIKKDEEKNDVKQEIQSVLNKEEEIKNDEDINKKEEKTDNILETIKQLLHNTNEKMIGDVMEICNNYKKENDVIVDDTLINNV
jgi:hypothetical protein